MSDFKLGSAVSTDLTTAFANQADVTVSKTFKVAAAQLDSPQDQEENTWTNPNWGQYLGYYKKVPVIHSAIDTFASWVVGKGFKADPATTLLLDNIKGNGKENIYNILRNLLITYQIGGDSYAEIIRDKEGNLINLKTLSPDSMQHVFNKKGMLIRFEQINKVKGTKTALFKPEEIFYLCRNRIGDEMHGTSIIESLEEISLSIQEAWADWKRVLHRNVDPLQIHYVDEDDATKIATYTALVENVRKKGETLVLPKDKSKIEVIQAQIQSPLTTIDKLEQSFYQSSGVPDIVNGSSRVLTEASAKIAYLSYGQKVEYEQRYIEEEFRTQLNLIINMINPIKLQNEAISNVEVESPGEAIEPNDMTAEMEGRK